MRVTDLAAFAVAHATGATVIDVREPSEYAAGHVPGARLVPFGRLTEQLASVPTDQPVYVICASGVRSLAAAKILAEAGIDARSVAGGTNAWTCEGRQVVRGDAPR